MTKIYTHNEAAEIIELFEDILNEHGIIIPDAERTGDETEGCLYGETYSDLLDDVENALIEIIEKAKNPETKVVSYEFAEIIPLTIE